MTLFKKVFDNHYSDSPKDKKDEHEDGLEFDDFEEELLFDEEDGSEFEDMNETETPRFSSAYQNRDTVAEEPRMAPELPSAPSSVAPVAPQSRAIKPEVADSARPSKAPVTQPVENAEENLSLAERAAKAHALIQSQGGKSSQPLLPSGTPLRLEQRVSPLADRSEPEKSEVVPLRGAASPIEKPPTSEADPMPEEEKPPRKSARARTRLLGFHSSAHDEADPMQAPAAERAALASIYPTGWLVVTDGPGAGRSFAIQDGVSTIGRGDDQTVVLDFGDNSISRQSHAAIAYDSEQNKFFLGHGGKSNIIRLNNQPVLSTEELGHEDIIRIGETTLRFVALCGEGFKWERS
ncbi:MAG: FHA domain-containing protein [Pseudomonadota bacterium]